jgi:two-component system response regulator TctD
MRLLLAEDDAGLATWLVRALGQSSCEVDWVADGRLVRRAVRATRYDALILDLGLPGLDGHDVLADLRESDEHLPILVLTARASLMDRVTTLKAGADDFLAKPFEIEELEARLHALVRRARGREVSRYTCGHLAYEVLTKRFEIKHQTMALTAREHGVLRTLIQCTGEPLAKREIYDRVFADDSEVNPEAIEVLVHRLRKRLAGSGAQITTLRGLGYVLEPI